MDLDNVSIHRIFFDPRNRETLDALVEQGREQLDSVPEGWSNRWDTQCTYSETKETLQEIAPRVNAFLEIPSLTLPHLKIRYDILKILGGAIAVSGSLLGIYLISEVSEELAGRIAVTGSLIVGLGSMVIPIEDSLGEYDRNRESIIVPLGERRQRLQSILAHEYTHHLQNKCYSQNNLHWRAFFEGHAMGVQKQITESLAYENKDFAYIEQNRYLQSHLEVAQRLFKEHHEGKHHEYAQLFWASHSIGHAVFQLAEQKFGVGIYRDALKGKLAFLDLHE